MPSVRFLYVDLVNYSSFTIRLMKGDPRKEYDLELEIPPHGSAGQFAIFDFVAIPTSDGVAYFRPRSDVELENGSARFQAEGTLQASELMFTSHLFRLTLEFNEREERSGTSILAFDPILD